jgi:hypothetical protein
MEPTETSRGGTVTRPTVVLRPRAWSGAAAAVLGAGTVLLLQVGLSAWHGAALGVALLLVALGVASGEHALRAPERTVPR